MESWMKRGFLQRSGTTSKPLTSGAIITSKKTADDHSSDISSKLGTGSLTSGVAIIQNQPQGVLKIPAIVIVDEDVPGVGCFPGGSKETQAVKLPYNDENHTTEPYTISLLYNGAKEAFAV
jgi:hypothetical protein